MVTPLAKNKDGVWPFQLIENMHILGKQKITDEQRNMKNDNC